MCAPQSRPSSESGSESGSSYPGRDDFEGISYSQEETVQAFRDYYGFLAKMYLNEARIVDAPPGGHPSITKERYRGMCKNDTVDELIRHLPYLRQYENEERVVQVAPYTEFWNFLMPGSSIDRDEGETVKGITEAIGYRFEDGDQVPAQVLAFSSGKNDPLNFLLDTDLGVVYWLECPLDNNDPSTIDPVLNDPYDWAPETEADWRNERCWPVVDFFRLLKEQFLQLRCVPVKEMRVEEAWVEEPEPEVALVRDVYRAHGWPDLENFRKEECMAAIRAALMEKYPDYL